MEVGTLFSAKRQPSNRSVLSESIKTSSGNNELNIFEKESFSTEIDAVSVSIHDSADDSLQELLTRDYDRDRRHFNLYFFAINIIAAIEVGIIVYIFVNWLDGFRWHPDEARASDFNVHLVCTVLGCVILNAYGILLFRAFPNHPHNTLVIIHTVIMIIVVFITSFGIKVSYDSHHIFSNHHLYSMHGWMGVSIFGLLFFELVTGNLLLFNDVVHESLKYWHMIGGVMLFLLSLPATISGILTLGLKTTVSDNREVRTTILNVFGLLAAFFSILVRYLYTTQRFRRRPRPGMPDQDLTEQEIVLAIVRNSIDSPEHNEETKQLISVDI